MMNFKLIAAFLISVFSIQLLFVLEKLKGK
jgi:hypothetical protein